jgi:hypothetical protein
MTNNQTADLSAVVTAVTGVQRRALDRVRAEVDQAGVS